MNWKNTDSTENFSFRNESETSLSRRSLIHRAGIGGIGIAAAPGAVVAALQETDDTDPEVRGDDTVVVVDGTEPNSLLPPAGTGPFQHVMTGIYETLVEMNADGELEPLLATSWEVSDDNRTWTFHLRDGVKFHDGTDFTSEAVKVSLETIMNPDVPASRRSSYLIISDIDDSDSSLVRITTDPPSPDLAYLMSDGSARIVSPANLAEHGIVEAGQNHPVGTGPYRFVEWVPNSHISLVRFDEYWSDPPEIENFVFRPIPEVATRTIMARTGEADFVFNLPTGGLEDLENDDDLIVHNNPALSIVQIEGKVTVGPLSDRRVRYALNMAIDKDAIIEGVMNGYARPLHSPTIPGLPGAFDFEPLPYDPEQAKALVTEAGYPDGFSLTMIYVSGRWSGDDRVVEAVQGFWEMHLGVQIEIERRDLAGFVEAHRADPEEFPEYIMLPQKSSYYTDYHLYRMYHTSSTLTDTAQRSGYNNPEVDRLLEEERQEFDVETRMELFRQVQELIWDDMPFVPLFQASNIWSQQKDFEGFEVHAGGFLVPKQIRRTAESGQ